MPTSRGGERPQLQLSGTLILRGSLRVVHLDPILTLPLERGESLGRIALPLARIALCLRLHPPFLKVLIAAVRPQAGCSTDPRSFKSPLRLAERTALCSALINAQAVDSTWQLHFKLLLAIHISDTGSPARVEVKQVSRNVKLC